MLASTVNVPLPIFPAKTGPRNCKLEPGVDWPTTPDKVRITPLLITAIVLLSSEKGLAHVAVAPSYFRTAAFVKAKVPVPNVPKAPAPTSVERSLEKTVTPLAVMFAVLPVFASRTEPLPVSVKFGFVPALESAMPAIKLPFAVIVSGPVVSFWI